MLTHAMFRKTVKGQPRLAFYCLVEAAGLFGLRVVAAGRQRSAATSGARHASNRSNASVLPTRARACLRRCIVRTRWSSGKSRARRLASAKNSLSRFAAAQASMIWSSSSLSSFSALAARRAEHHRSVGCSTDSGHLMSTTLVCDANGAATVAAGLGAGKR